MLYAPLGDELVQVFDAIRLGHTSRTAKVARYLLRSPQPYSVAGITGAYRGLDLLPAEVDIISAAPPTPPASTPSPSSRPCAWNSTASPCASSRGSIRLFSASDLATWPTWGRCRPPGCQQLLDHTGRQLPLPLGHDGHHPPVTLW